MTKAPRLAVSLLMAAFCLACGRGMSAAERLGAKNKAVYKKFVEEVLNKRQVDEAGDFITPEYQDHSLPPGSVARLETFQAWLREFQAAFPDGNWSLDVLIADGDTLAQHKTFFGTHKGAFLGQRASGKSVNVVDVGIIRFSEGKMVEFWTNFDRDGLLRQIRGTAPAPKPAAKTKAKAPGKAPAKKAVPKKVPTKKPTPKPAVKKKTNR